MLYVWVVTSRSLLPNPRGCTKRVKMPYNTKTSAYDVLQKVIPGVADDGLLCTTPYGDPLHDSHLITEIPNIQALGTILYIRKSDDTWKDLLGKS